MIATLSLFPFREQVSPAEESWRESSTTHAGRLLGLLVLHPILQLAPRLAIIIARLSRVTEEEESP